jgi:signal transduction histidine kinase
VTRSIPSLSSKLTRMNLLVSGSALVLAALAFFLYDLVSFRQHLIGNVTAEAQIIGDNSVSALTFKDRESAATTLASLQRAPHVLGAALTTPGGELFAQYGDLAAKETSAHVLSPGETDHAWALGSRVLLAHRIIFHGKPVGVVYITAKLTEVRARARQYIWIAIVILIFCMIATLIISSISQRLIARPIQLLANTARIVTRDQDYSVRASTRANSHEMAVLIEAFNGMLDQIQQRETALTDARTDLEVRVEERTAELRSANRELEAFSYTVAHDLRGPLDGAGGIAYLLEKGARKRGDAGEQSLLEQLRFSVQHMGAIINDLLNFARASTGPVSAAAVNLSAMAQEIANELSTTDPSRAVKFVMEPTPEALADPGLMRIVLDNLLRNAWKYTSHHAQARIEFGSKTDLGSPGKAIYFVRDDGAGFDPSGMGMLFQPFQRLHERHHFPGTGIGLATVSRILGRQGGSIWAEAAVEKGATFYFTLS